MVSIGYQLSSEEHPAADLVASARRAEEVGFDFTMIADHFHPWTDAQGESPFVWSVLGALAYATERIPIGTGVTCPLIRTHPAIVAHAAATAATMMPGRFFLGVGTGENLNEHVLGDHWPPIAQRRAMLDEAIEVMRTLWQGGVQGHRGEYYTVEHAQIFDRPDAPPPVLVAASGKLGARLAATGGDGLISIVPASDPVEAYHDAGGDGPRLAMTQVCWAATEAEGRRTMVEQWPNGMLGGLLPVELRTPSDFEAAGVLVREEDVTVPCGPDPEPYLELIQRFIDAGYDHVYLHQVGHQQEEFFRFCERELFPHLDRQPARITA